MEQIIKKVFKLYRIFQALSFDTCIGAVAGGIFAQHVAHSNLHTSYYFILLFAVYFIYTIDHTFDARMIGPAAARFRYRFHYFYYRIVLLFALVFGLIALALALLYMPKKVIVAGALVFMGVGVHLLLAQFTNSVPYMKEISVALYYTTGIWIAPLIMRNNSGAWELIINIVLFYVTVLANLFIFSWMEIEEDKKDGSHSIAVQLGVVKTNKLIYLVFLTGGSLISYLMYFDIIYGRTNMVWLPSLLIILIHLGIYKFPVFFKKDDLFRSIGDGSFIIYGIVYFFK